MSKHSALTRAKKRHAHACLQDDRISEALLLFEKICESDPKDAESWFMAGTLYGRLRRYSEAEAALRKAVSMQPESSAGFLNLGHALELQGKFAEAETQYLHAMQLEPNLIECHDALGRLCQLRGDLHAAIVHFKNAIQLNPSRAPAYLALARAQHQLGDLQTTADNIDIALKLDVENADAYYDLAVVRMDQGCYDDALVNIRHAQRLKPENVQATAVEAYILDHLRDYKEALECLNPVLDRYREYPEVALVYARFCHFTKDYEGAIYRLEDLLSKDELGMEQLVRIHFCLGNLYDQRREYVKAFTQFQAGNRLKSTQFDVRNWEERITNLIDTFSREAMLRAPRAGNSSERPIFIVGMPRSGTTVVEQMLSMLPDVAVAGELADIAQLAEEFDLMLDKISPLNDITQLTRESCDGLAQRYLDKLHSNWPMAKRVTDKMPQNFLHLGLITLLFPMARVIHCVRDPLDTCLSCYFQKFTGNHPYAYDLGNLGAYYRQYQRLMNHWQAILDIPIFELRYEDLVGDPNRMGRALVKFCGLKWDKRCLEFHNSENNTATASFQQVRQPLYATSIGRWMHYADRLDPLKRSLAGG